MGSAIGATLQAILISEVVGKIPFIVVLLSALASLVVSAAVVYLVVERIAGRRLREVARFTEQADAGHYLLRLPTVGEDEIAEAGTALNHLLARVTTLRVSMIDQTRQLQETQAQLTLKADLASKSEELEQRLNAEQSYVAYDSVSPFEIPDGSAAIPYKTKRTDTLNEYVDNAFWPKSAGDYLVCASLIPPASNQIRDFELDLFVNDSRGRAIAFSAGTSSVATGCTVVRLAMGDKLEVRAHAPTAAIAVTTSDDNWDWLTITRVH